jgi:hypothetical protein
MLKMRFFLVALIFWLCLLTINLKRQPIFDRTVLMDNLSSEKISWKNNFDLVVIGDSRTLIGISPQAMNSVLPGYKIGNLGFVALIYSQDYLDYIRSTLHSPVKNKVIVVAFSPRSLLSQEISDCYFKKWYNEAQIPLIRNINKISQRLQVFFRELSENDLKCKIGNSRYLMLYFESGWLASRLFPENARASKKQYKNSFIRSKINLQLLEVIYRNTEVWNREGIKVFGIRVPTSPGLFTIENKMSGFDERIIRQRFERSGGIWLNPSISYFVAYDGSHLRYDSAVLYSKSLAQELKKLLIDQK